MPYSPLLLQLVLILGTARLLSLVLRRLGQPSVIGEMTAGIVYALRLAEGGQPVEDLVAVECAAEDGARYWGGWQVLFIQP